jgi:hypothetical protein
VVEPIGAAKATDIAGFRTSSYALADTTNVDPEFLGKLKDELQLAFASDPERNSPQDERLRYVYALMIVSKFLHSVTKSPILAKRFADLGIALLDLDYGIIDPLFKPPSKATSTSSTRIWCGRAKVALVVDAYICAGLTREQAANEAAVICGPAIDRLAAFERRRKSSSQKSAEDKRTLNSRAMKALNWYDQFKKPSSKINPAAREIFEQGSRIAPLGSITEL